MFKEMCEAAENVGFEPCQEQSFPFEHRWPTSDETEEEILAIKLFLAGGGVSIIAFQPIILKLCLYAGVRI